MSAPSSAVYMCAGVRLNNKYDHTIYFTDETAQRTYFFNKCVRSFAQYSYVRKNRSLKVEATIDEAREWSYLYYANDSKKTYYAFITDVQYVNENVTEVFFEIDVMQTYHFDYELLPCFVDREHLDPSGSDAPLYTDEGLDVGELVVDNQFNAGKFDRLCLLCMSTIHPTKTTKDNDVVTGGQLMDDKVFYGNGVYAVDIATGETVSDWTAKLSELDSWGKSEAIMSMWMYPRALITFAGTYSWEDGNLAKLVSGVKSLPVNLDSASGYKKVTKLDGYSPKNKKLLCYPFNFLYVSNNQGQASSYKYEYFRSIAGDDAVGYPAFRIYGTASPEACVKLVPEDYRADGVHYEEGLTMSSFPQCAWNADTYKIWLAQNQKQLMMDTVMSAVKIGTGVGQLIGGAVTMFTGGGALVGAGMSATGVGSITSGLTDIMAHYAMLSDKDVQPAAARGSQSGSVNISAGFQDFTFYQLTINQHTAKRLDDFFTMYGYKTGYVKTPNTHSSSRCNYVKTVGSNVRGDFNHTDLAKINAIFDRGVTFWKDGDKIGDYGI